MDFPTQLFAESRRACSETFRDRPYAMLLRGIIGSETSRGSLPALPDQLDHNSSYRSVQKVGNPDAVIAHQENRQQVDPDVYDQAQESDQKLATDGPELPKGN
jgi:hypothetical protein